MAKIVSIKASSRASINIDKSYYTVEYCEERSIDPEDNIEEESAKLWDTCNTETDNQIEDILKSFSKR